MMNETTALAKTKGEIVYTPTGGTQAVKLTVKMIQAFLCKPTKQGVTCSDRDAMRFGMLCAAKGLNPWEGDAFLVGYDNSSGPAEFSLITSHQAFLKRAEPHPQFDGMESGVTIETEDGNIIDIDGDFHTGKQTLLAGWARVHFKDRSHPIYRRVKLQRFRKQNKFWNDDPAGMICKCAEADALRSSFPTLLGGLYQRQEVDAGGGIIDIDTSVTEVASEAGVATSQGHNEEVELVPEKPKQTKKKAAKKDKTEPTPQEQLASIVGDAGFNFDQFRTMAGEVGVLSDPSACGSWADVPTEEAKRCIGAQKGLLDGLTKANGGGE